MKKGFTLIEVLVVSLIILSMTALILPNFRLGEKQFALQRSAAKLAQDLRRAQGLSMSAASTFCPEGSNLGGYGISLQSRVPDNVSYELNAKCFASTPIFIQKDNIRLEKKITIKELKKDSDITNYLNIYFYPPDPQTDLEGANEVKIVLTSGEKDLTVKINKAGLINVE